MKKIIKNTQYLKKGSITNVGIVKIIFDSVCFQTTDGWSHYVTDKEIIRIKL